MALQVEPGPGGGGARAAEVGSRQGRVVLQPLQGQRALGLEGLHPATGLVPEAQSDPGLGQPLIRGVEIDRSQRLDHGGAGGHGPPHSGKARCRDAELELGFGCHAAMLP